MVRGHDTQCAVTDIANVSPIIVMSKKQKIILSTIVVLLLAGVLSYKPLKYRMLASELRNASTVEEEREAFDKINKWTSGYQVIFENSEEKEIYPLKDGNYEDVQIIRILFENGERVKRKLIEKGNVGNLLGE